MTLASAKATHAIDAQLSLFSQQPLFWAALAYVSGIALAALIWRPVSWFVIGAAIFISAAVVFRINLLRTTFLLIAFVFLGAAHLSLHREATAASPDISAFADGREVLVTAHVVRTGLPRITSRKGSSGNFTEDGRQVIDLQTETIQSNVGVSEAAFGIRLSVRSQIEAGADETGKIRRLSSFEYGERVRFAAKLREPRNYGNPGAMDYRGYLYGKGIVALASVPIERVEKMGGFAGSRWGHWREHARTKVIANMLMSISPERKFTALNDEDATLLLAMVIGEQSLLDRTTRGEFQRTGTFHILVVSGMNVGIVAFFVFWVARKSRMNQWVATMITLLLTLVYVMVTDLETPVLRAAWMLGIYLLARMLYRDRFSLNAVGIAALALLLLAPQSALEPSFQLTFVSMVALGGILQPLLERTSAPYQAALRGLELTAYDATLLPQLAQFRLDLRMICARVSQLLGAGQGASGRTYKAVVWITTKSIAAVFSLYELFMVSVIMQLALALPMTFYFHRLAVLGIPANVLILPITMVLMPAALLATLLQSLSATAAQAFWIVTALCLHGLTTVVQRLAGLQFAEFRVATPSLALSLLATLVFLLALVSMMGRRRRWVAAGSMTALLVSALLLAIPGRANLRTGVMELTTIDVGQGDSLLLVTPDGKTLLVDGGGPAGPFRSDNFDIGEDVVSPYLWSRGITRLDAIAVTHAHSDHLGGIHALMANFRPAELWIGAISESPAFQRLLQNAKVQGIRVLQLAAGDERRLGSVKLTVLSPAGDQLSREKKRNEDSLVMHATFGQTSVLLTGDAEKKTEQQLAISAAPASVLKVAHHGSGTSTTPELLRKVQPRFAVVSAGYRNLYGHPRADVLTRLRESKVRTYRTDIQGAVTFFLDGRQVSVETQAR